MSLPITELTQFREIVNRYEAFVFPIYGTLYDDKKIHEGAIECLDNLSKLGKTVAIFSNVALRLPRIVQDLATTGIPASLYQYIITAGEVTYQHLKECKDPFHAALGRKCYFIGPSESLEILAGLDFTRVHFIDEADFILASGVDEWHLALKDYQKVLTKAYEKDIPMICGNPDLYVMYNGKKSIRAGTLAQFYENLGGSVVYHGKPHKAFYKTLLQALAPLDKDQILILGDSVKTDILGAASNGFDSFLVCNATTLHEMGLDEKSDSLSITRDKVYEKFLELDIIPTYFTKQLRW